MSVSRDGRHVRRRRLTIGCVVAALLLHAAAAWLLLRSAPALPPRSTAQTALAVRWLHVSAPPTAHAPDQDGPQRTPLHSEAGRPRPARVARRVRAAAAAPVFVTEPVVVTPPAVTPVAIDGGVFALPRIGYGDAPGAAGVRAFAVTAATPPTPPTGAHEALRRQIAEHIERQLAALPPPPADGRCTLAGMHEPQLLCDSDPLTAALGGHAVPLARLVAAHQRSMPGGESAVIESRAGAFRLSLP